MVASWGRAGSLALSEVLEGDLRARSPDGRVTWYHPVPYEVIPSRPWSIYHTRSIEQLAEIDHMGIVVALRQPSLAALSSSLVSRQGYTHVHTDEQVQLAFNRLHSDSWTHRHEYHARLVRDSMYRRDFSQAMIPMDELRYRRLVCMNWNDLAAEKLAGLSLPMEFDAWHGDIALAARMMNVRELWGSVMLPDPRPLIDRVANAEEVTAWLDACMDEDASMLASWSRLLSGSR